MDELLWELVNLQKAFTDSLNLSLEEGECLVHLCVVNEMITDKLYRLFDIYNEL